MKVMVERHPDASVDLDAVLHEFRPGVADERLRHAAELVALAPRRPPRRIGGVTDRTARPPARCAYRRTGA